MKPIVFCLLVVASFGGWGCTKSKDPMGVAATGDPVVTTSTLLTGYQTIWGMDFLPNGDLVFGEKRGRLYRRTPAGTISEITGLPPINSDGQGGLLDIRVDPDFTANGWVYATYASGTAGARAWNLARFRIDKNQVNSLQLLLTSNSSNNWAGHYGSRIEFEPGTPNLFVAVGEGGNTSYGGVNSPNQNAQNLSSTWGKIHRIQRDGSRVSTNPNWGGTIGVSTVYALGLRNPQGLAWNPFTQALWETEHGPKGGDEVNIIAAGQNYGWPRLSFGVNYDNVPVSANPLETGFTAPLYTWTPSIAPSGMVFLTADAFKSWKGNLMVGALAGQYLSRLVIENNKVVKEEKLLAGEGRVRCLRQGPDGALYVSIEGPGRIIKMEAK